jgi:hypothetical protein
MDIKHEEELEEEKPLKSAVGNDEQIDVYPDRVVIRGKGLSNMLKVRATFTPTQITSIIIKPAGTLYDGNIEILSAGVRYYVKFKQYMQPDFEQVKVLLSK